MPIVGSKSARLCPVSSSGFRPVHGSNQLDSCRFMIHCLTCCDSWPAWQMLRSGLVHLISATTRPSLPVCTLGVPLICPTCFGHANAQRTTRTDIVESVG